MAAAAEAAEEAAAEAFSCRICDDVMLDPTTLSCCGKSFCRRCLRQWIRTSVHSAGIPRCPGGCTAKLPIRLPARSHALQDAIESVLPKTLDRRLREAEEDEETDVELCLGGLKAWQEVAANRDIIFGSKLGVRQGTPGIVVGNFTDGFHVTVRFDEREDGFELCVNVLPEALMTPLPGGFRLGQRVVALYDLMLNDEIGVRLGTGGCIVGRLGEDRLLVHFDARVDSRSMNADGPVSVSFREVQPQRPLVGGFFIAQRVQSAMDLIVGSKVVVRAGTCGSVLAEFSDTRLTVAFDRPPPDGRVAPYGMGGQGCFNVLPIEIKPWCEPPKEFPIGCRAQVLTDLLGMNTVLIPAGTCGVVLGGVDEAQVFVYFDAIEEGCPPHALTVETYILRKVEAPEHISAPSSAPVTVRRWSTWPPLRVRQGGKENNEDGSTSAGHGGPDAGAIKSSIRGLASPSNQAELSIPQFVD